MCVPDQCVPERKFLDVLSLERCVLGQCALINVSRPWTTTAIQRNLIPQSLRYVFSNQNVATDFFIVYFSFLEVNKKQRSCDGRGGRAAPLSGVLMRPKRRMRAAHGHARMAKTHKPTSLQRIKSLFLERTAFFIGSEVSQGDIGEYV